LTNTSFKYAFTRYLSQSANGKNDGVLFTLDDTDHALESCEDQLRARSGDGSDQAVRVETAGQDLCRGLKNEAAEA